jgi:hypothetical protein
MSSLHAASLPPSWAQALGEAALRPATSPAQEAARWFDDAADSAEVLRAPASTAAGDSAAVFSARFFDSLLQS